MCREPALLTTYLARMMILKRGPSKVVVVSADTPTAWRLRWPAHFSIRILSTKTPASPASKLRTCWLYTRLDYPS